MIRMMFTGRLTSLTSSSYYYINRSTTICPKQTLSLLGSRIEDGWRLDLLFRRSSNVWRYMKLNVSGDRAQCLICGNQYKYGRRHPTSQPPLAPPRIEVKHAIGHL